MRISMKGIFQNEMALQLKMWIKPSAPCITDLKASVDCCDETIGESGEEFGRTKLLSQEKILAK